MFARSKLAFIKKRLIRYQGSVSLSNLMKVATWYEEMTVNALVLNICKSDWQKVKIR